QRGPLNVLRQLERTARSSDLLERFLADRDEAAFEGLLRLHGGMVMGVCRRILGNRADAEDAFQATFVVLARKANSIVPRSQVGNWLYGVARYTAIRMKAMNHRRQRQQAALADALQRRSAHDNAQLDALDEQLAKLPDKYRIPIVLCDLEGRRL